MAHEGGMARAAGIVLRFVDPQDFYVVEADVLAGRVRLLRVLNGERREIASRAGALAWAKPDTRRQSHRQASTFLSTAKSVRGAVTRPPAPGRFGIWSREEATPVSATCSSPFWIERAIMPTREKR